MKKHILIVDDEAEIRDLLARCLTPAYRVSTAATAAEALHTVHTDPPQLLISDLQLEDSDGLTMIAQLKEALPALPVILLTGVLFEPEVVNATLGQKISCYLPKTSPLAKIKAEIGALIGT